MLKLMLTQGASFNTGDYNRSYMFKIYDENDALLMAVHYLKNDNGLYIAKI